MSTFVLSCCSSIDLTAEHIAQKQLHYIPFHFFIDGKEYVDDLGQTIPFDEFYKEMSEGKITKTSQINAEEYKAYFKKFLENGEDVLHVTLSSGITGTYNSARIAAMELEEDFPDRKIYLVDSLGASAGYGLLMDKLADLRLEGKTIDEVRDYAEEYKLNIHHWFFSTDLTYYVRGGRISKASGLVGGMLGICPLLNMDEEGHLVPRYKLRGKKKVISSIVEQMEKYADNGTEYNERCFISNSGCPEEANAVKELIEEKFPALRGKINMSSIGTTIGSHTGPGTVALFFFGSKREALLEKVVQTVQSVTPQKKNQK